LGGSESYFMLLQKIQLLLILFNTFFLWTLHLYTITMSIIVFDLSEMSSNRKPEYQLYTRII
jgi:hypothetical protein